MYFLYRYSIPNRDRQVAPRDGGVVDCGLRHGSSSNTERARARARGKTGNRCHGKREHDWGGPQPTGDPNRGEDPTEDPPPEGRATQGTHTEHTQTVIVSVVVSRIDTGRWLPATGAPPMVACKTQVRLRALRGQSRIRYSLSPPGFSESGIHLASDTGNPFEFLWMHVELQGFIKWANKNLNSEVVFSLRGLPT